MKKFQSQVRETPREYINGESHYFQGKRYLLQLNETAQTNHIEQKGIKYLLMHLKPHTTLAQRDKLMKSWYRQHLRQTLTPLVSKWEEILGVQVNNWGIRQMRTKWGSCNPASASVSFNLELAKKPLHCVEYIVAHELIHLHERHHNERFRAYLDLHLPHWKRYRDELNALPLGC